ncbi:MAG: hypothetical protein JXC36_00545 [Candidatus Atribacteria bacterium]|nr:hypothetical protein [Candidatus Atribacteria bacterium]
MEILGLIISILALALTIITYILHDNRIKKQEKLLNEYQLAKIETEKIELKKALIEANVIKIKDWKNAIKVYNKGKSIARKVYVTIPSSESYNLIGGSPCPIDLKPNHSIEFILLLSTEYPDKIEVKLEWEDDFNEHNVENQELQLL